MTPSRTRPPSSRHTRTVTGTPSPTCRITFVTSSPAQSCTSVPYERSARRTPDTVAGVASNSSVVTG
ncbi:hypothetical protein ABZ281_05270, partial [Streptomyces sp. NPDC006265]|uniref:hypothetical protein n=1 Tax=Streptomyces sp. NPDC006265 TaxID=3156740 RepID=UPI0033B8A754